MQPIAIAVIVAAGSGSLISNTKGKGVFSCSKDWIRLLCSGQGWRFKKLQGRKLPPNWKDLIYLMLLRAVYFISMQSIPSDLFVNADHIGIMYLQQKGGGWFNVQKGEEAHVDGHGNKGQFTLVHAMSASGLSLPAHVVVQGKVLTSLPKIDGIIYEASKVATVLEERRKKEKLLARQEKPDKPTLSRVVDRSKSSSAANLKTAEIASLVVTHDHVSSSKCTAKHYGKGQKMLPFVDCW